MNSIIRENCREARCASPPSGRPGRVCVVPGVCIEVQPWRNRLVSTKRCKKQCCHDRARHRLGPATFDRSATGARQPGIVSRMQRKPPECGSYRNDAGGENLRPRPRHRCRTAQGKSGPSATRAAPVRVAASTSRAGSGLSTPRSSRSQSTSRPSASVLPTSTVRPAPGGQNVQRAHGPAGHHILDAADPNVEPERAGPALHHRQRPAPSISAAPPMSFFMRSMPEARLEIVPARIEHDALCRTTTQKRRIGRVRRIGAGPRRSRTTARAGGPIRRPRPPRAG